MSAGRKSATRCEQKGRRVSLRAGGTREGTKTDKLLGSAPVSSWKLLSRCSKPIGGLMEAPQSTSSKEGWSSEGDLAETGVVKAVPPLPSRLLGRSDSTGEAVLLELVRAAVREVEGEWSGRVDQAWRGGEPGRAIEALQEGEDQHAAALEYPRTLSVGRKDAQAGHLARGGKRATGERREVQAAEDGGSASGRS